MCKRFCLGILAVLLLCSGAVQATDYYVSPSGSDWNSGKSPEKPWKSIGKVNGRTFEAGDRILFEGAKTFKGSLKFNAKDSCTPDNPVTVGSYGGGRATINSGSKNGLYADNCGGFVVKDLIFVGAGRETKKDFSGILFFTDLGEGIKPEHIRIDNVDVSGYRQRGIHISGSRKSNSGFRDVRITNADIHDNGNQGIAASGSQPPGDWVHKGIYVGDCRIYDNEGISGKRGHSGNGIILSSVDGAVIEYCEAYNNGRLSDDPQGGGPIGIWAWDSKNVVIQYCEAYDNKTGNKADGGGFDLDGGCVNCVMQYNYSHGNYGAGYGIYQYGGAREFKNNVVRYNITETDGIKNKHGGVNFWSTPSSGGIQNTRVYNNTIFVGDQTNGAGIVDFPNGENEETCYVYDTEIYNNIILTTPGKKVLDIPNTNSRWNFRGNCYWTYGGDIQIRWGDTTYSSLNEWRVASGQERFGGVDVGFKTDPKLVDAGAGGTIGDAHSLAALNAYRLTSESPLIDAGLDIESAFGIDAGKHDFYGTKIPSGGRYDVGANEFDKSVAHQVPLCWYKFEEGSGKVAGNSGSLGRKADGVLKEMGASPWVEGLAGGSGLYFGGDVNRVEVPALNLNSNTVTITAWLKRDGEQANYSAIVLSRAGTTTAGLTFGSTGEEGGWQPNNMLSYNWNDANQAWGWQSQLVVPNDKWVFVGLVVEPERASLYLGDGATVKSAVNNLSNAIEEFDGITLIGKDSYHDYQGHKSFKGVIDDVRIYNRALPEEEILVLAGAPKLERAVVEPGKYYVSPSGDDNNSGRAPEQAWNTIGKVNRTTFQAGDSILFEGGGTFQGSLMFDTDDSGTQAKPVTVSSYGEGRATISSGVEHGLFAENVSAFEVRDLIFVGAGSDVEGNFSGIYFLTDLGGDVKLEHIRVDNVEVSGYRQRGILMDAKGTGRSGFKDVRITNADIHGNGDRGITSYGSRPRFGWNHRDIYIGNCKIYDNLGFSDPLNWGHHGNGIVLSGVDGAVIEYCEAYNNGELSDTKGGGPVGIWAYDSNEVIIQFCEAHHNKTSGGDGGGFDIDGGCLNSAMQYNYSHNNHGSGYLICQYQGARPFKNNTCRYNITENDGIACAYPMGSIHFWSAGTSGGIQDTLVYGNTVYASKATRGAAVEIDSGFIYNTSLYNNILMTAPGRRVVDASDTSGGWVFKGNCYWSSGSPLQIVWGDKTYSSLAEWRKGTGQEMHYGTATGLETDPLLVNPGGGGTIGDVHQLTSLKAYKLQSSSPLIDAGVQIAKLFTIDAGKHDFYGTEIPTGGGFDIGAYEFSKGVEGKEPIGLWKFDEGMGTVARNSGSLGGNCDGRLNNMDDAAWVEGVSGTALEFDGKDDDVSIGAVNLNSNTATISAWVKRNGQEDVFSGIVYSRDGETIAGIGSGSTGAPDWKGNHELFYCWNDTEDTWAWHSGLIMPDKKWALVAVVLEPTKATLYLGQDGKLGSAVNMVNHDIEEFNGATRIGHDKKPDFPPRFFKGTIDDVRFYDRALSETEIEQLFSSISKK